MKRLLLFLFITATVASIAADYRVLVLGDIHYDTPEYHTAPNITTKYRLQHKYITMWRGRTQQLLTLSNKMLDKDVPFVIQCGDFTQGAAFSAKLQEKMLADGFKAAKQFFPQHKLLPIKGNHDVRFFKQITTDGKITLKYVDSNAPAANAFMPLVAKELGVKSIKDHYTVVHNNDLYIFYDDFARPLRNSVNFLKKTLAAHPKVRNIFFITHLPVIPCSPGNPGWLIYDYRGIAKMLMERNAIILTAHTHMPSLLQATDGKNTLTQWVTSSIGYAWNNGKKADILFKAPAEYKSKLGKKKSTKRGKAAINFFDSLKFKTFEFYQNANGFTVLKVGDDGSVTAELYNDASGKPALIKKLK